MKTQKTFLIVITILVATVATLQIITMMKKNKTDNSPELKAGVEVGDLTQEVIEEQLTHIKNGKNKSTSSSSS